MRHEKGAELCGYGLELVAGVSWGRRAKCSLNLWALVLLQSATSVSFASRVIALFRVASKVHFELRLEDTRDVLRSEMRHPLSKVFVWDKDVQPTSPNLRMTNAYQESAHRQK
ncbi:hypothetical protein TNCT_602021 [Trichonephila clavata]|uniref:Uncharacterized protein n=1 Tax=Trichonephila clavata TaxID=2740835 RepID=A0A8X6HB32_TRICU|nr:hypothetical protein TNCT_602021 [Trichonephila clavata]